MTDSCSDTELGMGGVAGESFQQRDRELMPVKRELDQEDVAFYKSVLVGHPHPGREYLTAGGWCKQLKTFQNRE